MKVYAYPSDIHGCGSYRIIWPAHYAKKIGCDVKIVLPKDRNANTTLSGVVEGNTLKTVRYPKDADVIVLQRPTHVILHQAVPLLREQGVAVVVDMDDDLSCIHPKNPAFIPMHPNTKSQHNWHNAAEACRNASLVTVSTEALAKRYGSHGRYTILPNRIHGYNLDLEWGDDGTFGWAGSLHSHPTDLQPLGNSVTRIANDVTNNYRFKIIGTGTDVQEELKLKELTATGLLDVDDWVEGLSCLSVGIAPLDDTKFNEAKSWLKPLEYGAAGVPWIASPRAEYVRLHKQGAGLLASRPREWYSLIKKLMRDNVMRQEHSIMAREVSSKHTFEQHSWRWVEAWTAALEYELKSPRKSARIASA